MPGPHAHLLIRDLSHWIPQRPLCLEPPAKLKSSVFPRACYIQWSESEKKKKKQTSINTYTWNLEKWYWWAYLQGRNREADMENRLEDTAGKERVGWISRVALRYVHYHVSATQLVGAAIRLGELSLGLCDVPEARGRGWVYTESWFALLYSRNQHNGKQFLWIKKKKVLSPELQMCLFDY